MYALELVIYRHDRLFLGLHALQKLLAQRIQSLVPGHEPGFELFEGARPLPGCSWSCQAIGCSRGGRGWTCGEKIRPFWEDLMYVGYFRFVDLLASLIVLALMYWGWYVITYRATKRAIKDACEDLGLTRRTWTGFAQGIKKDPEV